MQAPTGGTQASQSNDDPAPQALIGSNTVDKALELTNTLAAIVKEVAEVLNHAPYVKTLTGVILQFIKIKDELKTNKERCREIIDKVLNLSDWIYDKLAAIAKSRERVKENLAQVENSLIFCESTLTNVLGELKKHQARPKLVKFVSRGLEDLNKLDRSVDNLEKRLLRDIVFDIKLQQGMPISSDSENMDPASHPSTGGRDHALPPKPYLIVEREVQIDTALHILLSAEPSRIAILGGGGFGKTTLARAILHDPKIAERYQSRYFLSCEDMTDVEALLLGLARMLGITTTPSAVLGSIRSLLALSTTLLCLDNFETPWESSAIRTKTEDVLASIADIPNLSLIITMRGTLRPSKVAWSHPLLPPLSTVSSESARKILHTICGPDHIIDDATQNLLNVVDGIPLAINLISNLLRDGETSRSLWMVLKSSTIFPISHTKCLMSLGDLHDTEGQYTKAETYFREAAMLYKQAKDVDGEADALRCSGDVLARSGQLE
ncbi:P-loop containing nucleoside triphosphate hydrolase protein, partial [Pholiota molesta]